MPIIRSAVKRARQTKARTARNSILKRRLKEAERQLDSALAAGRKKDLLPLMSKLQSQLDTAVKKHLIHKNSAARTKLQYAARIKQAGAKPAATKLKKPPAKRPTAAKPKPKKK